MSLHGIPDFLDVLYPEFLNLAFSLTDISNFCFIFSTAEILSSIASTLLEMLAFAAPVFFKDFYLLYYIFLYFLMNLLLSSLMTLINLIKLEYRSFSCVLVIIGYPDLL